MHGQSLTSSILQIIEKSSESLEYVMGLTGNLRKIVVDAYINSFTLMHGMCSFNREWYYVLTVLIRSDLTIVCCRFLGVVVH